MQGKKYTLALYLFCGLMLMLGAAFGYAQDSEVTDESEQSRTETPPEVSISPDGGVFDSFTPTEDIPEDMSVPFPIDI